MRKFFSFVTDSITKVYNFSKTTFNENWKLFKESNPKTAKIIEKIIEIFFLVLYDLKKNFTTQLEISIPIVILITLYLFYTKIWWNDDQLRDFHTSVYYRMYLFIYSVDEIFTHFKTVFMSFFSYEFKKTPALTEVLDRIHHHKIIVFSNTPSLFNLFVPSKISFIKLIYSLNFIVIFYMYWAYKFMVINFFSSFYYIILNIWTKNDLLIYQLYKIKLLKLFSTIKMLSISDYYYYFYNNIFYSIKETLNDLFNESLYNPSFSNLPIFFYFYILYTLSTLSSFFLLSFLGFYGVFIINLITIILFWISSIYCFNSFFLDNFSCFINIGKWFVLNHNFPVYFSFYIDTISFGFMFLTLTIAVFVYIYTFSYFRYEPNVERLLLLINAFVISMICLVISGNFFVLFLGWELIGLTSFFLINFWSTRMSTVKSAFKAFVFNKVSDVSLLFVTLMVFYFMNDINVNLFNIEISFYNNFYIYILDYKLPFIEIMSFFFLICAFIKSAQFGFHIWLPDSMEAPVPASALIHSATLVSAGIYLLLRFSPMFEYSIYSYYSVPIMGSFTAFFGGICSCYQSDIKKILAYSTISHCGFLMITYSTYITEYTILYLYIHGFFKAAVFLCVGNIIRFNRNCQDFRLMGGFWKYLPFECFSSFICLINLSGLPFTIGFYIKHLLLIGVYLDNIILYFIFINVLGGAISGLFYSYRLFYYVFFDFKKAKKVIYNDSNSLKLLSKFYSNTTVASNIAIFGLIITSYIVSLYLLNVCLNKNSLGEGLDVYSIYQSQYEEFNHPLLSLINNISYFNWLLLIIIFIIITMTWRVFIFNHDIYDIIYKFILLFIFIYIFTNLVCLY